MFQEGIMTNGNGVLFDESISILPNTIIFEELLIIYYMILVKNRYRKTLFKIKNNTIYNQGGKVLGTFSNGDLLDSDGEVRACISEAQVTSAKGNEVMALVSGSEIQDSDGKMLGYVDGSPAKDFLQGAATLVTFAY